MRRDLLKEIYVPSVRQHLFTNTEKLCGDGARHQFELSACSFTSKFETESSCESCEEEYILSLSKRYCVTSYCFNDDLHSPSFYAETCGALADICQRLPLKYVNSDGQAKALVGVLNLHRDNNVAPFFILEDDTRLYSGDLRNPSSIHHPKDAPRVVTSPLASDADVEDVAPTINSVVLFNAKQSFYASVGLRSFCVSSFISIKSRYAPDLLRRVKSNTLVF